MRVGHWHDWDYLGFTVPSILSHVHRIMLGFIALIFNKVLHVLAGMLYLSLVSRRYDVVVMVMTRMFEKSSHARTF